MNNITTISQYLQRSRLITDGSFGTYYADEFVTNEMPELANTDSQKCERVVEIHKEYVEAGAKLIRTNTFAANTVLLNADYKVIEDNIKAAVSLARKASPMFIAGDIGPIPTDAVVSGTPEADAIEQQYYNIAKTFINEGIDILTFETFPDLAYILPAIKSIKAECTERGLALFIMVQFSVNQFGYSNSGLSASKLIAQAAAQPEIDAVGLNCGVGPAHMEDIISSLKLPYNKYIIALPNAGYPERIRGRIRFANNPDYFADKTSELVQRNDVDIIGGCCGTTPDFIRLLTQRIDTAQHPKKQPSPTIADKRITAQNNAFFYNKNNKKLIAVELAPPINANDEKILEAANLLKQLDVDVLTFPDSPSGRTRIDSVLMAEKVRRETNMCVMPHICCRDKNAIAMRSMLLGAHINDIHNLLVVTGDPVPSMARPNVKSVFNFDAVGLMNIIKDMNDDSFNDNPMVYGGAINQGRRNLDVEINRVKKKLEAGAQFFLTQPIFTKEDAERVRRVRNETGARILCGIMPPINKKNALFIKNEIAGIDITDDIIRRYPDNTSREEGEKIGIELACEVIGFTEDFADGYYFEFPFNRVHMLGAIKKIAPNYKVK